MMPNGNQEDLRREDELKQLKRLLFQDEIERLGKLEAHLKDHSAPSPGERGRNRHTLG